MILVRYRAMSGEEETIRTLLVRPGGSRRRDDVREWYSFREQESGDFIKTFVLPSWLDHLRQHERVTEEEARLQAQIREVCDGCWIEHYISSGVE